jgi:hypothetical protein
MFACANMQVNSNTDMWPLSLRDGFLEPLDRFCSLISSTICLAAYEKGSSRRWLKPKLLILTGFSS